MFDLNDIWRVYGLGEKQRPSEWKNNNRKYFNGTANIRSRRVGGKKEGGWQTLATLEALYAYAMWVDVVLYIQQHNSHNRFQ